MHRLGSLVLHACMLVRAVLQRVSVGLLTSHEFGRGIENAEKPEFGHVSCTKYFYDIGHVGEN